MPLMREFALKGGKPGSRGRSAVLHVVMARRRANSCATVVSVRVDAGTTNRATANFGWVHGVHGQNRTAATFCAGLVPKT